MDIDYGPLTGLIGSWRGDQGLDVAPEPNGTVVLEVRAALGDKD